MDAKEIQAREDMAEPRKRDERDGVALLRDQAKFERREAKADHAAGVEMAMGAARRFSAEAARSKRANELERQASALEGPTSGITFATTDAASAATFSTISATDLAASREGDSSTYSAAPLKPYLPALLEQHIRRALDKNPEPSELEYLVRAAVSLKEIR